MGSADIAGRAAGAAAQKSADVLFERAEIGLEELAAWNHHHIDGRAGRGLAVSPKNLSHQAFGAVSGHGVPDLPAGHEPEPRFACCVRNDDERDIATMPAASRAERPLELGSPADPAASAETLGLHGPPPGCCRMRGTWRALRWRRYRQPLPALGPPTLQDEPTVLRAHAHQEAVRATATTTVWLERTFHDCGSLVARSKWRRNVDSSEARATVSILRTWRSRLSAPWPYAKVASPATPVGSPPEVFHNCGKKCGKAIVFAPQPAPLPAWHAAPRGDGEKQAGIASDRQVESL
jgi:hypothetical protein